MIRNFLIVCGIILAILVVGFGWSKSREKPSDPLVAPANNMMVEPVTVP
jgi:hypothetical protein